MSKLFRNRHPFRNEHFASIRQIHKKKIRDNF